MHTKSRAHTYTYFANSEMHSDQPFSVFRLFALLQWNAFRSASLCVLTVCPVTVKCIQINLSVCSDCLPCYSEMHSDQPFCVFWLFPLAVGRSSWRRNRRGRLWRTLRRDTTTSWSWRTLYESCTICLWTWPCLWRVRWDHSLEWAHWVFVAVVVVFLLPLCSWET